MDAWMDGWMHGMTIERDKLQGINPLCKLITEDWQTIVYLVLNGYAVKYLDLSSSNSLLVHLKFCKCGGSISSGVGPTHGTGMMNANTLRRKSFSSSGRCGEDRRDKGNQQANIAGLVLEAKQGGSSVASGDSGLSGSSFLGLDYSSDYCLSHPCQPCQGHLNLSFSYKETISSWLVTER